MCPNSSAQLDQWQLIWLSHITNGGALRGSFVLYTIVGMSDKKKHDDTTIKLDMGIEDALRKAVEAGPYPKAEKKPRRPRSSRDTKSPAPRPAKPE